MIIFKFFKTLKGKNANFKFTYKMNKKMGIKTLGKLHLGPLFTNFKHLRTIYN